MIETINLTKNYGNLTAVKNLNLTVNAGEIYGFLGPNGAGKTTTIKMICGLLKPTKGRVKIDGIDISESPIEAKSKIGLIPDTPNIYPKLTGREFLYFIADIYDVQREVAVKRAEEIFEMFDLKDKADELIETYSHGMKQKIVIGAALVHDPSVIILDEPTVGLDPKSAKLVKDLLRALAGKGKTVFMSTHILEIAERMCDKVGIINEGTLIAEGTIDELRKKAKDETADLEKLFLELTGGEDTKDLVKFLEG
ncbi:MAG: ABC transporter ATP-binding protein [Caldisericaceae bacterium]|nr:ABC transporter ATP-binding protein [Caldisericaceae bacterium]